MAFQSIKIKRGSSANLPTLELAELGFTTDSKKLYIGNGISNTIINPDAYDVKPLASDIITTDYVASVGELVFTDTTGGSFKITLPNSGIRRGDRVVICDINSSWTTDPLTVIHNGLKIDGNVEDFVLDVAKSFVSFVFVGPEYGWKLDVGGSSILGKDFRLDEVYVYQSADYTAVANDAVMCNTSGGSFTVTLPELPIFGTKVRVLDSKGYFNQFPLYVNPNGKKILGSSNNYTINNKNAICQFIFEGENQGWLVDVGGSQQLIDGGTF